MIERPSRFFSFNPAVLEVEGKLIPAMHLDNLTSCKDINEKVSYVFHATQTKDYTTKITGINLLRRSHRVISRLYNSVVLFLFWDTILKKANEFLEPLIKPDFSLEKADQDKWLNIKKFLKTKKFTEERPLLVKIDDTVYSMWENENRVEIQAGKKSLNVLCKKGRPPFVLNEEHAIIPKSTIYPKILEQLYGRTPEGIIESGAILPKNRPCAEDASDTAKLDYLLTYLTGDHQEDATRLLFQDDKNNYRSVLAANNKKLLFCNDSGAKKGTITTFTKKKDGTWGAQDRGSEVTRDLNDQDKISIQLMVSACRTHTYNRASKMADAMSSQVVLDPDKWKLTFKALKDQSFQEGDQVTEH